MHRPAIRIVVSLAVVIPVLTMSDMAAAQVDQCKSIRALKPKADALAAAVRRLSTSGTDPKTCQDALRLFGEFRSIIRQAGEACAAEKVMVMTSTASSVLFPGRMYYDFGNSIERVVLNCENAGVIPLRVSQHSCPAQADYENEERRLLREAMKLRNAERTPQVCDAADDLSRKIWARHGSIWDQVRSQCQTLGITLPVTERLDHNPVDSLCSRQQPFSWSNWFTGYRGIVIVPVGLIVFGLIWLFRLMARR